MILSPSNQQFTRTTEPRLSLNLLQLSLLHSLCQQQWKLSVAYRASCQVSCVLKIFVCGQSLNNKNFSGDFKCPPLSGVSTTKCPPQPHVLLRANKNLTKSSTCTTFRVLTCTCRVPPLGSWAPLGSMTTSCTAGRVAALKPWQRHIETAITTRKK